MNASNGLLLGIIAVLLVVLALLALAEMSLSRINMQRAQTLISGRQRGRVLVGKLAQEPSRWVNPLLLTVNLLQTLQATLTGIVAGRMFGTTGIVVGVLANVVVFFLLTEALPKTYAVLHPLRCATLTAPLVYSLTVFWPLRMVASGLTRLTRVLASSAHQADSVFVNEQEFLGMVEAAADEQVIEPGEHRMIESVIALEDTMVRAIMVPRPDMVVVDRSMTVSGALDVLIGENLSRAPVSDGGRDELHGTVHIKDLLVLERAGRGAEKVAEHTSEVIVVPETCAVGQLMRRMQEETFHLALVADEYGAIVGLATLEDCLEEIVGEIVDEHDEPDEGIVEIEGVLHMAGTTPVSDLCERLNGGTTEMRNSDSDSVGGFVFDMLGRSPESGDTITCGPWRITVLCVEGRRVTRVGVSKDGVDTCSGSNAR